MLRLFVILLLMATAVYFGCIRGNPTMDPLATNTAVGTLLANANAFDGRRVIVKGTVKQAVAVFGVGAYRLKEGDAEVLILTSHGIPEIGSEQSVSGVFKQAFALNSLRYAVILQK